MFRQRTMICMVVLAGFLCTGSAAQGQGRSSGDSWSKNSPKWRQLDRSVERSLVWLANHQQPDGSFETIATGQPAVTALCVMAFLGNGANVGEGEFGPVLKKAVDYIVSQQQPNGLIASVAPPKSPIPRDVPHELGHTSVYNHAISSLALATVYGQGGTNQNPKLGPAIERAIVASLEMQNWKPKDARDRGGWRYLEIFNHTSDSDLSITGWELMFLRSARDAGFDVPAESIQRAVEYIKACYDKQYGSFSYRAGSKQYLTRAMAGAGILALAHAGMHESEMAIEAGDWILKHPFERYNATTPWKEQRHRDRYHYGVFHCCQAMYQLGGRHWAEYYPHTFDTLLSNQRPDGSWPPEQHHKDGEFGNCYTTALSILTLSAPNQLLPIFQR